MKLRGIHGNYQSLPCILHIKISFIRSKKVGKNKKQENYMDFVPLKNKKYSWSENEKGRVIVEVPHEGFYDKIAQKFFKTPKISNIELDDYGSFVWKCIDGVNTIYRISEEVHKHFGEKAEPLLNRLVKFFQILKDHKFIIYSKEGKD